MRHVHIPGSKAAWQIARAAGISFTLAISCSIGYKFIVADGQKRTINNFYATLKEDQDA